MCYPLTMEINNPKEDNPMKALSKVTRILACILEIAHIVGACIMAVMLVCCIFVPNMPEEMIAGNPSGENAIYGFHFTLKADTANQEGATLTIVNANPTKQSKTANFGVIKIGRASCRERV